MYSCNFCKEYHDGNVKILTQQKDIELAPYRGVAEKRNVRIHSASNVASKFAGFKSCWLISTDSLKHRIRTEWAISSIPPSLQLLCNQCRRRLSACVKAGSGHFETGVDFDIVYSDNCDLSRCRWPSNSCTLRPVWFNFSSYSMVCSRHTYGDRLIRKVK